MRSVRMLAVLAIFGCARDEPPERQTPAAVPPRTRATLAAHVERAEDAAAAARARGGFRSVVIEGSVPAPCPGGGPLVQAYGPVDSAVAVRVSLFVPLYCQPGVYPFAFTAVVQGVAPGRVPVEVTWDVSSADPRGHSFRRILLRDSVTVLP